jgi:hypothetical protein
VIFLVSFLLVDRPCSVHDSHTTLRLSLRPLATIFWISSSASLANHLVCINRKPRDSIRLLAAQCVTMLAMLYFTQTSTSIRWSKWVPNKTSQFLLLRYRVIRGVSVKENNDHFDFSSNVHSRSKAGHHSISDT